MKKGFTYIGILLDRSGSMQGSEDDVVGGVNAFIEQQRKVPGQALVTIAKFDTEYETVYEDADLQSARLLTPADFEPRGGTALADATSRLMTHIGAKLAAMPESDRPDQVIILVFSDGGENASKEVTLADVQKRVKHQEKEYSWKFLFFGMDIDAKSVGGSIGVRGISSQKTSGGVRRSAKAASAYVGYSRLGDHKAAEQILSSNDVADKALERGVADFAALVDQKSGEDDGA